MGFGVFIHRADSIYEDSPAERYQYLGRAEACAGDWIVYYEPRKVPETRGYFAVAKVRAMLWATARLRSTTGEASLLAASGWELIIGSV